MDSGRVSAIIPVHNRTSYIGEAIASIRGQSRAPLELIVVDDGSTDGTAAFVETLGSDIRLIRQPHAGVTVARNRGILAARGDFIAFLDSDDVWTEGKLSTQVPILLEHPDVEVVLGHTRRMSMPGAGDGASSGLSLTPRELALSLGAALIRRSTFETIGAFDESLPRAEDWDWFMRLRERGAPVVVHPEVTQLYRRHAGNMTNEWSETRTSLAEVIGRSIARRRSLEGAVTALPDFPSLDQYLRRRRSPIEDAAAGV